MVKRLLDFLNASPINFLAAKTIFDNEETGSQTKQGAGSPSLSMMLKRIALAQSGTEEALTEGRAFSRSAESMQASLCSRSIEAFYQAVERAFMISADNAHAWHPNYSEKYDPTNHPMLGGGHSTSAVCCAIGICRLQTSATCSVFRRRRISAAMCRPIWVPNHQSYENDFKRMR